MKLLMTHKSFRSQIDHLHKRLQEQVKRVLQYLKYDYRLTIWLNLNNYRRVAYFLKRHFELLMRLVLIAVGLGAGVLINNFGGSFFTQDILSNYLVSVGALMGGTIAIVFTISIFLLQGAADLYSSQYFEVYIHDWKEKIVYFLTIIATLIFFGSGLYVGSLQSISNELSQYIVVGSLVIISGVFGLIDWQYSMVRKKVNPLEALSFLERQAFRFLEQLQSDAQKMAGIIQAKDGSMSEEMALAATYNQLLQPHIDHLDRQLENLVQISMRLADRQEIESTKQGLSAIHNTLAKFLEIRKNSSLAMSSSVAILAVESDSQNFLSKNFERLNKAGRKFMREGKDESATYIVDIYYSLARKAKEIKFLGRSNENPILENIEGYLNFLIEAGIEEKNMEVVYRGSNALGNLAVIFANIGLHAGLLGIQGKILKIAMFAITQKHTVLLDSCTSNYLKIIEAAFVSKRMIASHQFDTALENIATITHYILVAMQSGYLPNNFTTQTSLSYAYNELASVVIRIINRCLNMTDGQEKDRCRHDIVEFFEELSRSLRTLSKNVNNVDSIVVGAIGRLIYTMNDLMIQLMGKEDFVDEKDTLKNRLRWYIHLPFWFMRYADKFNGGSGSSEALVESVAKTGVVIFQKLGDEQLVIDCIESIYSMAGECLAKTTGKYGFDEPRMLEKACYLGILALKSGQDAIVTEVGLKIYEFESKYFIKYFSDIPSHIDPENHNVIGLPHSNQLFIELLNWRRNFNSEKRNRMRDVLDNSQSRMYPLIDRIDIDWFMFEIWGSFPAGSEIEEVIVERNQKKALVKNLAGLLNGRAASR